MKSLHRVRLSWLWLPLIALFVSHSPWSSAEEPSVEKLQPAATTTLTRFKKADPTLEKLLSSAAGYAIFPKVGKGGLVFGGASGAGLVYQGDRILGTVKLSQVTFGAQIGGQVFAELILFEDQGALDQFKESRFEMSAQVGAVAAAEGVAENAKYIQGVLVFTMATKGLMAEASVGGQKFEFQPLPKP